VCLAGRAVLAEVVSRRRRDVVMWTPTQAALLRTSKEGEPLAFRLCGDGEDWLAWDQGEGFTSGSEVP
jgi:hypothetical protein